MRQGGSGKRSYYGLQRGWSLCHWMVDGRDLPAVQLIQLIFEWMFLTVFNHYLLEKAVGI